MEIWCRWLLKNLPALDEVGWFENLTKANFLALPNEDIDRSVFFNLDSSERGSMGGRKSKRLDVICPSPAGG